MSPRRIQMTRQRPWRHDHPDAVIVARPTRWGNPYPVKLYGLAEVRRMFYKYTLANPELVKQARRELRGFDLACWCPLDAWWCHADDWLQIVNGED